MNILVKDCPLIKIKNYADDLKFQISLKSLINLIYFKSFALGLINFQYKKNEFLFDCLFDFLTYKAMLFLIKKKSATESKLPKLFKIYKLNVFAQCRSFSFPFLLQ
jgi:hypothetical protein